MYINNRYINDNNILDISFKLVHTKEDYVAHQLDDEIWVHYISGREMFLKQKDSFWGKRRTKIIEESSHAYMVANLANRRSGTQDYYDLEAKIKQTAEMLVLQKKVLSSPEVAKYKRYYGHIEVTIEMGVSTIIEEILRWSNIDRLEGNAVHQDNYIHKQYEDSITIQELMRELNTNKKVYMEE